VTVLSLASGCVERASNVTQPPATPTTGDADVASNVAPLRVPFEVRDGGEVVVSYRAPLRPCDDACLRNRGGSMLRLLRLAHRMPDRMRRVLQAMDMPYARLWMAWLARHEGDEADARTYLAEALEALRRDPARAQALDASLARVALSPSAATLDEQLAAAMRAQLDHWVALDPALGAEASRVLPCAVLARAGAPSSRAFRPRTSADAEAARVVVRCGEAAIDALRDEAQRSVVRAAVDLSSRSIAAIAPADPAAVELLRARLLEPFFVSRFAVEITDDAAVTRAARAAPARAALASWTRARGASLTVITAGYCASARSTEPALTDAQCAARVKNAVNSATKWWLESSASVAVVEGRNRSGPPCLDRPAGSASEVPTETQWTHGQRASLRPLRDGASRSGHGVRLAYIETRFALMIERRVHRSSARIEILRSRALRRPGGRRARFATLRRAKARGLPSGRVFIAFCSAFRW
jgi:hypothetical protein